MRNVLLPLTFFLLTVISAYQFGKDAGSRTLKSKDTTYSRIYWASPILLPEKWSLERYGDTVCVNFDGLSSTTKRTWAEENVKKVCAFSVTVTQPTILSDSQEK